MKIINSKDKATDGKWSKPTCSFYDSLMKEENWKSLLHEAFLVCGNDIKKDTVCSDSGCKYPHHVIKNNELVLHASGVRAAYSRARQMGVYEGKIKRHLERHMNELGIDFKESYDGIKFYNFDECEIPEVNDFDEFYKEKFSIEDWKGNLSSSAKGAFSTPISLGIHICSLMHHVISKPITSKNGKFSVVPELKNITESGENDISSEDDIESHIIGFIKANKIKAINITGIPTLEKICQNVGGSMVIEGNSYNLNTLRNGNDLKHIKFIANGSEGILIFSPKCFRHGLKVDDLNVILSHEFGHIKTFTNISKEQWLEYFYRIFLLRNAQSYFSETVNNIQDILDGLYYQLLPERIANEYVGIDYRTLFKAIKGYPLKKYWKGSKLRVLVETPIPASERNYFERVYFQELAVDRNQLDRHNSFVQNIYNRCV